MTPLSLVSKYIAINITSISLATALSNPGLPRALDPYRSVLAPELDLTGQQITLVNSPYQQNILAQIHNQTILNIEPIVIGDTDVYPVPVAKPALRLTPVNIIHEPPIEIDALIHRYAGELNLDPTILEHLAYCESHYHSDSISSSGNYGGLFQFSVSTWISTRTAMKLDTNPGLRFNPEEATKTAAFKISHGGISAWPVCSK
jgi:hypothetical protein